MFARIWFAILVAGLVFVPRTARSTDDNDQFREDTILCEEAVAHLESCCPGFDPSSVQCTYDFSSSDDCDDSSSETLPGLSIDQSNCVRSMSCSDLVSSGFCTKVAAGALPIGPCQ
jgi:hypothetical protein